MKTIYIIVGSIREVRVGIKIADWILGLAKVYVTANNIADIEFELVDLKDWPLPMFALGSPKYEYGKYKDEMQIKWSEKIKAASGFIIVTPEYNHGYSSVLKNALDYLYHEWGDKPVSFVGYGGMGGVRAIQQLKQVALELKLKPTFAEVDISRVWDALDESGVPKPEYVYGDPNSMFKELIERVKS